MKAFCFLKAGARVHGITCTNVQGLHAQRPLVQVITCTNVQGLHAPRPRVQVIMPTNVQGLRAQWPRMQGHHVHERGRASCPETVHAGVGCIFITSTKHQLI